MSYKRPEPGEGQSASEGGTSVRILKRIFGFEKVRYRGIQKNHQRLCASFALVNLYLHRRRLVVARA